MEPHLIQGTQEWLDFRKLHITGTDASIIMGASHWKTRIQLYNEKTSPETVVVSNERMQRGLDLEPEARKLFSLQKGIPFEPAVIVKDWAMASLDGINFKNEILEIKCPGERDHALALNGKVPDHYFPQLQHQMYVADAQKCYYFSFDGLDGVTIEVQRDDAFIEKMISEELKFYECLINRVPPEPNESDYIERNDDLWQECASRWIEITQSLKELEKQEEEIRKQLIFLSGGSNCKGGGISFCQVKRKGNVDYSKIPELKNVDLEKYRKETITSWRLTCQN